MRINTRYIYVLSIIAVLSLALTGSLIAKADPPGSPPYGAYAYIAGSNKGSYNWVGSKVAITISFSIDVPAGEYGTIPLNFATTVKMAAKASIGAASAVGISREYGTNKFLSAGGNGDYRAKSYDGILCDHTVVVVGHYNDLIITKTWYGYKITEKYIVDGYYWKHGWACFDTTIPFKLDVSSVAAVWGNVQGLNSASP